LRVGFIGCGSHSFRNLYPCLSFLPVELVATCDLDAAKAAAFAAQFGAKASYTDYKVMLEKEKPEAVLVVTGYDVKGRPLYPPITEECLRRGVHVWMEKPPADTCADVDRMRAAEKSSGRWAQVGFKKMFVQANVKAKELSADPGFGHVSLVTLQYPMHLPTVEEMRLYRKDDPGGKGVVGFLDHLCHPVSLMLYLLGWPATLSYQRGATGAGVATFAFPSGALCVIHLAHGAGWNGGLERTWITGERGRSIVVENNLRLEYRRDPKLGYGDVPSFFTGEPNDATAVWQPEFSLGQLYNNGLFIQGYWGELNEFVAAVLEGRRPDRCGLDHAWHATRIFEAFAEGPDTVIALGPAS
jgi:predicted dehydrogenase